MTLDPAIVQRIRDILQAGYPGITDFSDARFVGTETGYKREASTKAQSWFSETALRALIDNEPEKLTKAVADLARETNLLFLGVPKQGDLALLYEDRLDPADLGEHLLDLLYGPDESPERLDRFSSWADNAGYANKWTFPTYLLFLVHPDTEWYAKPEATKSFLRLSEPGAKLASTPSGDVYRHILDLAGGLRKGLSDLKPQDNIDVQSAVFLAHAWGKDMLLEDDQREEILRLIEEFRADYVETSAGAEHLALYKTARDSALQNIHSLREAKKQGQEITDLVLRKLLPYQDTENNRDRGAWISHAPAIQGDVRAWFENTGWVKPGDWPKIADAIFNFVEQLGDHPELLVERTKAFKKSGLNKGFQAGMLSPVLNALHPEDFLIINAKTRRVINHFLGLKYDQDLESYPTLNRSGHYLIGQVADALTEALPEGMTPTEGFDAFSHWLVAVRRYSFGRVNAWRVQIPDLKTWDEWSARRALGYPDHGVGDGSQMSTADWKEARVDGDSATFDAIRHVVTKIAEGDLLVVVDAESTVRGIGDVSAPYEYHEGEDLAHAISVDWESWSPRKWSGRLPQKLITPIDVADIEHVRALPELGTSAASDAAFTERTFELLSALYNDPKVAFYEEHRDEFSRELEEPFKKLLQSVAEELPAPMIEHLETEKRLFSQIRKNDFGRGGAWPHYWGALYSKDHKRIAAAQLFIWINRNRVEWGFYVGDYADQVPEAMLTQLRRRKEPLRAVLTEQLEAGRFWLGAQRDDTGELIEGTGTTSIDQWLSSLDQTGLSARVSLTSDEVVSIPAVRLRDRIVSDFQQLFALVLIATQDDPIAAIEALSPQDVTELQPRYSLEDCAAESGFDLQTLATWHAGIERKGQAVFYGPPGTGKTYIAERLARVLISEGDGFKDLVQFHPAYAYEDFMQGIRPLAGPDGSLEFRMIPGRFVEFCRKAQGRNDTCVLIIDEINRANLSRVFGELMYLLEYRDEAIPLAGGGTFRLPSNVRIIGTMNTADRSIALVDHALRRRFAFLALRPQENVLRQFHEERGRNVAALIEKLAELNKAIGDENYHIGITFFLDPDLETNLEAIWRMEIEPYLEEYFFDDAPTVDRFRWHRLGSDVTGAE